MNRYLQILMMLAVIGGAFAMAPAPSHAQDYWNSYWGWYDNSYRPYYHRYYSSRPYSYGYQPYYGGYDYGYAPRYYDYGDWGYRDNGWSGGQVQVGPFSFGWR